MKLYPVLVLAAVLTVLQCFTQGRAPSNDLEGDQQLNGTDTSAGEEETEDLPRATYIVAGQEAQVGSHPYICELQVRQGRKWRLQCGSAIYNNLTVLTAAHCVENDHRKNIRIKCGSHNLNKKDEYQVLRRVRFVFVHPLYRDNHARSYPNDLAIIKLKKPLEFNSHISTLPIPDKSTPLPTDCVLMGWGNTGAGEAEPDQLRELKVVQVSTEQCVEEWNAKSVDESRLCFRAKKGADCDGDSGGPAVCGKYLVGVSSWGTDNCKNRKPTVYTSLPYYKAWIDVNSDHL